MASHLHIHIYMSNLKTKAELKKMAQDHILDRISLGLGYWHEQGLKVDESQAAEMDKIMKKLADKIARDYGYDESWSS